MAKFTADLMTKSMVTNVIEFDDNQYVVEQANSLGDMSAFLVTVEDNGIVSKVVTCRYYNEGKEYTRQEMQQMDSEFEPFELNSYVGAIFFDAAFG